ncbi:iron-containing redox enzyme family protein [Xenorhabdus thailandensis]|uniref:iron-containing redox enzyme family protein n=1 Tax=Xenorhabdus thailandensis TaxID=3136255 RepID=UPI0030F3F76C
MKKIILEEIDKFIDENRYVKHESVQNIVNKVTSLSNLKKWAIQKYYQTYLQNVSFSSIHSNAKDYLDIRLFQIEQLIGEETNIHDGSDSHFNLMKRFAFACGADEQTIKSTPVAEPVKRFTNYLINCCKERHPILAMLAIYCNERQTPESASQMANALKLKYGFSDNELEWFYLHGELDIEHSNHARNLILKYADQVDCFEHNAWEVVKIAIKEWNMLQNYYSSIK